VFFLHRVFGIQRVIASGIAATMGAVLFAAFHYIGPFGDPFQLPSFLFRFTAGLALTALYFIRGYGITAYTHSLYDVWITFRVI
jgi:Type II CAAX prenyl endopeptidase Rce1-like